MRVMEASSSLEVDDSTSIFFDIPLWEALRAMSFFSFLSDEELSWGLMCMFISWALIFPKMDVGVVVERLPWWSTVTMCPYLSMGRTHSIFLATSTGLIWLSPSPFSSSTITFKWEYILVAFSLGSISNVLSLFMTRWKRSSCSLLDPTWSTKSSIQSSWVVLWFRTQLNTSLQRPLKRWFLAFAFHFSFFLL